MNERKCEPNTHSPHGEGTGEGEIEVAFHPHGGGLCHNLGHLLRRVARDERHIQGLGRHPVEGAVHLHAFEHVPEQTLVQPGVGGSAKTTDKHTVKTINTIHNQDGNFWSRRYT